MGRWGHFSIVENNGRQAFADYYLQAMGKQAGVFLYHRRAGRGTRANALLTCRFWSEETQQEPAALGTRDGCGMRVIPSVGASAHEPQVGRLP
jgi:hypothetical protein